MRAPSRNRFGSFAADVLDADGSVGQDRQRERGPEISATGVPAVQFQHATPYRTAGKKHPVTTPGSVPARRSCNEVTLPAGIRTADPTRNAATRLVIRDGFK